MLKKISHIKFARKFKGTILHCKKYTLETTIFKVEEYDIAKLENKASQNISDLFLEQYYNAQKNISHNKYDRYFRGTLLHCKFLQKLVLSP